MITALEKTRRDQLVADLGRLMGERWGRRLFYAVTRELGRTHEGAFVGGVDEATAAWRDGRASLPREIQDLVVLNHPDLFAAMMREQQAEIADLRARERERAPEANTTARERKTP